MTLTPARGNQKNTEYRKGKHTSLPLSMRMDNKNTLPTLHGSKVNLFISGRSCTTKVVGSKKMLPTT
jgi:hypothetical protein